jgi:predicted lysophospholipase L1 biosynthesis ABC-type transport system permease subunit
MTRLSTPMRDRHRLVVTPGRLSLWTTTAIVSLALLVLAFVVSERLRIVLSGAGLAGLIALRLVAMYKGWPPRRPAERRSIPPRVLPHRAGVARD